MLNNKGHVLRSDITLAGWFGSSSQLKMVEVSKFVSFSSLLVFFPCFYTQNKNANGLYFVQQKVVLKILAMNDEKTKQKAMEAVADIYGMRTSTFVFIFLSFEFL